MYVLCLSLEKDTANTADGGKIQRIRQTADGWATASLRCKANVHYGVPYSRMVGIVKDIIEEISSLLKKKRDSTFFLNKFFV